MELGLDVHHHLHPFGPGPSPLSPTHRPTADLASFHSFLISLDHLIFSNAGCTL